MSDGRGTAVPMRLDACSPGKLTIDWTCGHHGKGYRRPACRSLGGSPITASRFARYAMEVVILVAGSRSKRVVFDALVWGKNPCYCTRMVRRDARHGTMAPFGILRLGTRAGAAEGRVDVCARSGASFVRLTDEARIWHGSCCISGEPLRVKHAAARAGRPRRSKTWQPHPTSSRQSGTRT